MRGVMGKGRESELEWGGGGVALRANFIKNCAKVWVECLCAWGEL